MLSIGFPAAHHYSTLKRACEPLSPVIQSNWAAEQLTKIAPQFYNESNMDGIDNIIQKQFPNQHVNSLNHQAQLLFDQEKYKAVEDFARQAYTHPDRRRKRSALSPRLD